MQRASLLFTVVHRRQQRRILKKGSFLNLLCDPGQLLIYNAPGSHIQMAYLRISHLSLRKPHRHAAGVAPHKGTLSHQPVHHRSGGLGHSVSFLFFVEAIAV